MKISLGAVNSLYPMLTVLVGANVNGRPNYITIAHVGIMDLQSVSLGMAKSHFTNEGIRENGTFSINIPSADMVEVTDYCGIVSGREVDKGALFTNFYGALGSTPMIEECPVNMECRLVRTVDFPKHDIFIGEVVQTYCSEGFLAEGGIDLMGVQPILFSMQDRGYWKIGPKFSQAWHAGKKFRGPGSGS